MLITQATIGDLQICSELFDEYRQFYRHKTNLNAAKEFIQARLTKQESIILIAWKDLQATGFIQIYPSFSSLSLGKVWILNDLLVRPNFRQQGIAKALILDTIERAKTAGVLSITLETAPDNIIAQKLYLSLNFKLDQTYQHYQFGIT